MVVLFTLERQFSPKENSGISLDEKDAIRRNSLPRRTSINEEPLNLIEDHPPPRPDSMAQADATTTSRQNSASSPYPTKHTPSQLPDLLFTNPNPMPESSSSFSLFDEKLAGGFLDLITTANNNDTLQHPPLNPSNDDFSSAPLFPPIITASSPLLMSSNQPMNVAEYGDSRFHRELSTSLILLHSGGAGAIRDAPSLPIGSSSDNNSAQSRFTSSRRPRHQLPSLFDSLGLGPFYTSTTHRDAYTWKVPLDGRCVI